MQSSTGDRLQRAAATPARPLDFQGIRRRGLVHRAIALGLVTLGVAGMVAAATVAYPRVLDAFGDDRGSAPARGPCDESSSPEISAFLRDDIVPKELRALEDYLENREGVASFEFASKSDAFEEFKRIYKNRPDLWSALSPNALPASFRIELEAGAPVREIDRELDGIAGVDEARSSSSLLARLCNPSPTPRDVCPPLPRSYLQSTIAPPKDGAQVDHYGVWVRIRVAFLEQAGCLPTIYMELDGRPVVPPDPGDEHGEFTRASSPSEACVRAESAEGNFLYSGRHLVGFGTGCDPDAGGPYMTQTLFVFDGERSSVVVPHAPLAFCDQARYLDELQRPPTDDELDWLVESAPPDIREEASLLVASARAHRDGDDSISKTDDVQGAADRFDAYVAAECRIRGRGRI